MPAMKYWLATGANVESSLTILPEHRLFYLYQISYSWGKIDVVLFAGQKWQVSDRVLEKATE